MDHTLKFNLLPSQAQRPSISIPQPPARTTGLRRVRSLDNLYNRVSEASLSVVTPDFGLGVTDSLRARLNKDFLDTGEANKPDQEKQQLTPQTEQEKPVATDIPADSSLLFKVVDKVTKWVKCYTDKCKEYRYNCCFISNCDFQPLASNSVEGVLTANVGGVFQELRAATGLEQGCIILNEPLINHFADKKAKKTKPELISLDIVHCKPKTADRVVISITVADQSKDMIVTRQELVAGIKNQFSNTPLQNNFLYDFSLKQKLRGSTVDASSPKAIFYMNTRVQIIFSCNDPEPFTVDAKSKLQCDLPRSIGFLDEWIPEIIATDRNNRSIALPFAAVNSALVPNRLGMSQTNIDMLSLNRFENPVVLANGRYFSVWECRMNDSKECVIFPENLDTLLTHQKTYEVKGVDLNTPIPFATLIVVTPVRKKQKTKNISDKEYARRIKKQLVGLPVAKDYSFMINIHPDCELDENYTEHVITTKKVVCTVKQEERQAESDQPAPFFYVNEDTVIHISNKQTTTDEADIPYMVRLNENTAGFKPQKLAIINDVILCRRLNLLNPDSYGTEVLKGVILHGPPGTGKTRMAHKIATLLGAKEENIKEVNAGEIHNKYVGQSEKALLSLIKPAEESFASSENNPPLHVIIFDEMDGLFMERTSGASAKGYDGILKLLMAKMTNPEWPNNLILIGTTNYLSLIDAALIRPGRFGVQIEFPLPDKIQRSEIFRHYCEHSVDNLFLGEDIDYEHLAEITDGTSGAHIQAITNKAMSLCMTREIDLEQLSESKLLSLKTNSKPTLTMEHFTNALKDKGDDEKLDLAKEMALLYDFIPYRKQTDTLCEPILALEETASKKTCAITPILIAGPSGAGKSGLARHLAKRIKSDKVYVVKAKRQVGIEPTPDQELKLLANAFMNAKREKRSVIIVDKMPSSHYSHLNEIINEERSRLTKQHVVIIVTVTPPSTATPPSREIEAASFLQDSFPSFPIYTQEELSHRDMEEILTHKEFTKDQVEEIMSCFPHETYRIKHFLDALDASCWRTKDSVWHCKIEVLKDQISRRSLDTSPPIGMYR